LFERVEPPFDFFPLLLELFDPLPVTLWHWLSDQKVMLGHNFYFSPHSLREATKQSGALFP
jgi:hypothetical protein